MIELIFCILILFTPVTIYVIYNHSSDGRVYQKNLFDWIVYVLAWLAVPFFILSCFLSCFVSILLWRILYVFFPDLRYYDLLKGKNWEERRRKNLYLFVLLCVSMGVIFGAVSYTKLNLMPLFEEYIALGFLLFFAIFGCVLCVLWKLMNRYEEHIERTSFIPVIKK